MGETVQNLQSNTSSDESQAPPEADSGNLKSYY